LIRWNCFHQISPFARAVPSETQKLDRFRTFPATLARVFLRKATKIDELGFARFQGQAKPLQSLAQYFLDTKSLRAILETQHKIFDVPHQIRLASLPRLDHALKPKIEQVGRDEP
jgi:hypothetical protein